MDARFYNSEDIDIERLAADIVNVYLAQGYQAQQIGTRDQMLVQLKKGGDFEAIIGMQAALSLTLQRTAGGVLAMIGQQRWVDKAAVGAVGIVALPVLWPLAVTAGVGALRQASLGNQVLNIVDGLVRQQRPGIMASAVPAQLAPSIQRQWTPPPALPAPTPVYTPPAYSPPTPPEYVDAAPAQPASSQLYCPHCNTPYEQGDTFCSGCGRALTQPKLYCSNCNSEVKPGSAFCPKCGASTFHTQAGAQQSTPRPAPAPQPSTYTTPAPTQQTPTYTPPTPVYQPPAQTPVYTPPPRPTPPPEPAYVPPTPSTPPVAPQPTVYYVPSSQSAADAAAPTVSSQPAPQKPAEPYYVPPAQQEPPVVPQPKVTIVTSTPRQEPPPPQKPRPQKQYYIPSNQAAQGTGQVQDASSTATQPARPITTQPSATPVTASAAWGTLTFDDGQQVQLRGERAVVGRYDHDLGGIQPEVDLSRMPQADTTSRIHAALEHVGSTYTLTDLNSTNSTRINGKRLEPDKATPINDGDTILFGKVSCTFHTVA